MSKKQTIIFVLVVFIVLVAIIALVLKSQMKSGTGVPATGQTNAPGQSQTPVSSSVTENASVAPPVESIQVAGPVLNALPGSPEAPKQEVVTPDKIPAQAVKMNITASGFSPKTFRVKAGAEITLALTASDGNTHVFLFPNASLMGLTTMVLGGETKTLIFNAPIAGSYPFRDDLPAYRSNTGTMIVE